MRKLCITVLAVILLAGVISPVIFPASAQDPTAIPIVVTVILVFPSDTPSPTPTETLTPTDGPSPTPTATASPTPASETSVTINGQDVILDMRVTPGEAAIVGLLTVLVGFAIVALFKAGRPQR